MNDRQNTMPGGFPGSSVPSFEDPVDHHNPNSNEERHVHFDDNPDQLDSPPRDISQDTEEVIFVPDPEVPQPGMSINDEPIGGEPRHQQQPPALVNVDHDQHRDASHQSQPPPSDHHHQHHQHRQHHTPPSHPHHHQRGPPQQPAQHHAPPRPPIRVEYPLARPLEPTYLPPGAFGPGQPPIPYDQPYLGGPYDQSVPPLGGPWLQNPGMQQGPPFGGPPPWTPPPRHAEFHHSHQQIRRRVPRRPAPPLPLPVRVRSPAQQQPVQIQVQEQQQQIPQIQVQHIPAPQTNNNGNGNMISDAMQMMMMNQMMSQQMNAQQMQAAQFGAMIGGVNGGRGGGSEVTAQATCGGPGGVNVQNCQNHAIGHGGNNNPRRKRRRRVRKRVPKAKPRGGLKIQVGDPRPVGVPPPPPRLNAPLPPPPVESLVADNWQEATIILCLAVVALIYLMASRAGGSSSGKKDPSGASLMARGAGK